MSFHIDKDSATGTASSCRRCRSEDSNADGSDEESLGNDDGKEFSRSIRGKCTASLTDGLCKNLSTLGIVASVVRSEPTCQQADWVPTVLAVARSLLSHLHPIPHRHL